MKKLLFFILFVSIAHLFYGQEMYTITGKLPDHSLDNTYLLLAERSALGEEHKRASNEFRDSILIKDRMFVYEGVLSREPFLASVYSLKNRELLSFKFVIEAGDIHICVSNWADGAVVSGTPINEDYNNYMLGGRASIENQLCFFEKYASCPNVIRWHLSFWIDGKRSSKHPHFSKFMQVVEKMPEPDRSILLDWHNYTIQKDEYEEKVQPILNNIRKNRPRYVEIVYKKQSQR